MRRGSSGQGATSISPGRLVCLRIDCPPNATFCIYARKHCPHSTVREERQAGRRRSRGGQECIRAWMTCSRPVQRLSRTGDGRGLEIGRGGWRRGGRGPGLQLGQRVIRGWVACCGPVRCLFRTGRGHGSRLEQEGGGAGEGAEERGVEGRRSVEGVHEEAGEVAGDLVGGEVAGKARVAAAGSSASASAAGAHGLRVGGVVEEAAVAAREGAGAAGRAVRFTGRAGGLMI
jgi:hypothetical protein